MHIRFSARARIQVREAYVWYESKQSGLCERFLSTLDSTVSLIVQFPSALPFRYKRQRGAWLQKFLFVIFYRQTKSGIHVFAVLHCKRNVG
ncbi:MAG: plasmid stabilization system [Bacteroidetes bacterium]|nr:MAG: plasmid stabilization system [Bacteroidota bacterium]